MADADPRLERVEALLRSLTGIVAARVQAGPGGEIRQIHLVLSDDADPSQASRNAQSALIARLGIHVAPGTISTSLASATTANGGSHGIHTAPAASEPATARAPVTIVAPVPASARPRICLDSLELERRHSHRLRCRVTITCDDQIATGEAEGLDAPGINLELAARAAADATTTANINRAAAIEIDGVRQIEIAGRAYIMVAARAHLGRTIRYLAGVAAVEDLPEDAAALASLQAVERSLADCGDPVAYHPK